MADMHPRDVQRVTVETVTEALAGLEHGRVYQTRPGCVRVEYAQSNGQIDEAAAEAVANRLIPKHDQEGWKVMANPWELNRPESGYASIHDLAVWHPDGRQYLEGA